MRNATIRMSRSSWAVSSDPHAAPSPAAARARSCSVFGGSSLMPHIFSLKCARGGGRDREFFKRRRVPPFHLVVRLRLGILPQPRTLAGMRCRNDRLTKVRLGTGFGALLGRIGRIPQERNEGVTLVS